MNLRHPAPKAGALPAALHPDIKLNIQFRRCSQSRPYESYSLNKDVIGSFSIAEKNEKETSLALVENENNEDTEITVDSNIH